FFDPTSSFAITQFKLALSMGWQACAAVIDSYFRLGDQFWRKSDWQRAKRVYDQLFQLLKEYAKYKGSTEEQERLFARCAEGCGKIDLKIPYTAKMEVEPSFKRIIDRSAAEIGRAHV